MGIKGNEPRSLKMSDVADEVLHTEETQKTSNLRILNKMMLKVKNDKEDSKSNRTRDRTDEYNKNGPKNKSRSIPNQNMNMTPTDENTCGKTPSANYYYVIGSNSIIDKKNPCEISEKNKNIIIKKRGFFKRLFTCFG